ncbi:transposase [Anaerorudis cellulosivorans]|uniref:transposase n=1 Tax=Anaerorudis cellulosivorans TaxID=3397862 RepID=UPI00221F7896|nr:transposase [Seramator thermalis]MCW1735164.1 transposase [Seramator thermalis]
MNEKKENPDYCSENTHGHFRESKTLSEITNDLVTESLKYCLKTHIENTFRTANLDEKLTSLFSETEKENPFNEKETHFLVEQINRLKILDLTVGDGTLLVEVLNKLTFLLSKLDPLNEKWKQQQIMVLDGIADPILKSKLREKIETVFSQNKPDYARKRYLFQNCLYGLCSDPSSLNAAKHNLLNCLLEEQEAAPDMNAREDIDSLFHLETNPLTANAPIGSSKHREEERCHTNRSDDEFDPERVFGIENKSITLQKQRKLFHITWGTYNSRYHYDEAPYPSKEPETVLLTLEERNLLADILAERIRMKKYRVLALNVLQDHVHLLLAAEEEEVDRIIDDLKGYSSYTFHREQEEATAKLPTFEETASDTKSPRKLWQRKYHTILIENKMQFEKASEEIQNNHLKHNLPPIDFNVLSPALTPFEKAFDPETISTGFDIVFGNLHCVSATVLPSVEDNDTSDVGNLFRISTTAKEVPENEKNPSIQSCEFADELYARLVFKGFELLKSDGILALLIPQSSWESLAESTVNALLRKNNILEISDTPSSFSGRISTTAILLQKRE